MYLVVIYLLSGFLWTSVAFFYPFFLLHAQVSPFRVVIDPGHGGADLGAVFRKKKHFFYEKSITLQIARQVAAHLRAKGVQVALTRQKDSELALTERTRFANEKKASLFISLHLNSAPGEEQKNAQGVETFILNHSSDASSKRLSDLENSVLPKSITEFATDSDIEKKEVALILKDLTLDANRIESYALACELQNKLVSASSLLAKSPQKSRLNRGVKESLFFVLLGADMPSALVEIGFLSHPQDRKILLSRRGQFLLSKAIADAILSHKNSKMKNNLNKCKII